MFGKIAEWASTVDWKQVGKIACYVGSAALTAAAKIISDGQRTDQFEGVAQKFCESKFADLNFINNKESL
jgi:hypothetical protein